MDKRNRIITRNTIRQNSAGRQKQFLSCWKEIAFVALPGKFAAAAERTVINITVRSAAFSI